MAEKAEKVLPPSIHSEGQEEKSLKKREYPQGFQPIDLAASNGVLSLNEDQWSWLGSQKNQRGSLPVTVGNWAHGMLPVQMVGKQKVNNPGGKNKFASLELKDSRWQSFSLGQLKPVLAVWVDHNQVKGFISAEVEGQVLSSPKKVGEKINHFPDVLGIKGFSITEWGVFTNQFADGKLDFGIENLSIKAYFFSGTAHIKLLDSGLNIEGTLLVRLPGVQNAEVQLSRNAKGELFFTTQLTPYLGTQFSGSILLQYQGGIGKIEGTLNYQTEKLSGEVKVMVARPEEAQQAITAVIGPENLVNLGDPGKVKTEEQAKKATEESDSPVLMGWGDVSFKFNKWLTGKSKIVFDHRGYVTVVGEIALPPELPLMPRGFNFKTPEVGPYAKAFYGIPVLAEVYVAGGLTFYSYAVVTPLVLRQLRIEGIYSTDPAVLQHFNIMGSLNVSAEAGISLSVWAKIGASILAHDISLKGTLESVAGIKAYADAEISLGYQEKQDPLAGKQGDFIFTGMFEFAAQPFLALKGSLAFDLDTPWISPISDRHESWPFLEWIYPLPVTLGAKFGLKDYVIGSDPQFVFELGQVEFNTDKFLDSVVEQEKNSPPSKSPVPIHSQIPAAPPALQTPKNKTMSVPYTPLPPKQPPPKEKVSGKQPKGKGKNVDEPGTKGQFKSLDTTDFVAYAKTLQQFKEQINKENLSEEALMEKVKGLPGQKKYNHQLSNKKGQEGYKTLKVLYARSLPKGQNIKPIQVDLKYHPSVALNMGEVNKSLGFKLGTESHKIEVVPQGKGFKIMMKSTPEELVVKIERAIRNIKLDSEKKPYKDLLTEIKSIQEEIINDAAKKYPSDKESKGEAHHLNERLHVIIQKLLQLNPDVLGENPADPPFLDLEFEVGTHSKLSSQKKGQPIEADHQPQDAILDELPQIYFGDETQPLYQGTSVMSYKHSNGICINLHKERHRLGRTWRSKGGGNKERFMKRLDLTPQGSQFIMSASGRDRKKAKEEIWSQVRAEFYADINTTEKVVADFGLFKPINEKHKNRFVAGQNKQKNLHDIKWDPLRG